MFLAIDPIVVFPVYRVTHVWCVACYYCDWRCCILGPEYDFQVSAAYAPDLFFAELHVLIREDCRTALVHTCVDVLAVGFSPCCGYGPVSISKYDRSFGMCGSCIAAMCIFVFWVRELRRLALRQI